MPDASPNLEQAAAQLAELLRTQEECERAMRAYWGRIEQELAKSRDAHVRFRLLLQQQRERGEAI